MSSVHFLFGWTLVFFIQQRELFLDIFISKQVSSSNMNQFSDCFYLHFCLQPCVTSEEF